MRIICLPEKVRQYLVMGVDGQRRIWLAAHVAPHVVSGESAWRRGPQPYASARSLAP